MDTLERTNAYNELSELLTEESKLFFILLDMKKDNNENIKRTYKIFLRTDYGNKDITRLVAAVLELPLLKSEVRCTGVTVKGNAYDIQQKLGYMMFLNIFAFRCAIFTD